MSNRFGNYLRKVRKARKLKLREVAEAVNKSTAYICDLELGRRGTKNIDQTMLIELSDFLNVPVSEILYRAGHIDREFEIKYGSYLRILRSKNRAQRVGKCLEGCKELVGELKNMSGGGGSGMSDVVISLESHILELEQTLSF